MGINILSSQSVSYTDSVDKTNILNKQFALICTEENQSSFPDMTGDPIPDIPPIHIEVEGVKHFRTRRS